MPTDPGTLPPFDPGVVSSGGYSTNILGAAAATPAEPTIFAGWGTSPASSLGAGVRTGAGGTGSEYTNTGTYDGRSKVFLTPTQFLSAFDRFDRDDFLKFRNLFIAAGIVSPEADPLTVRNAYASVIGEVVNMAATGRDMSPMGYVKNLIRMNGLDPSKIGADENYGVDPASEPFTGSRTTTSRNVTEVSEGEAWSTLQNTLSNLLGRDPNDQETRDFVYRMNQMAATNPSISKTVTQYKDGIGVSSSTHTDPGFTGADMAEDAYDGAQNDPDYAEYRAATTYFNSLMSALGPIGG